MRNILCNDYEIPYSPSIDELLANKIFVDSVKNLTICYVSKNIISYWEIKLEYQEILGEPAGRIPIFNLIF